MLLLYNSRVDCFEAFFLLVSFIFVTAAVTRVQGEPIIFNQS